MKSIHVRLQEIIEEVKGKPEEMVISTVMLRSMQQAKYDPESLGHFGLSTEFYTHFTSPIRRYPDLIVHRLIRTYLIEGKVDEATTREMGCELYLRLQIIHLIWNVVQLMQNVKQMN